MRLPLPNAIVSSASKAAWDRIAKMAVQLSLVPLVAFYSTSVLGCDIGLMLTSWPEAKAINNPVAFKTPTGASFTISHFTAEKDISTDQCIVSVRAEFNSKQKWPSDMPVYLKEEKVENEQNCLYDLISKEVKAICSPSRIEVSENIWDGNFYSKYLYFGSDGKYRLRYKSLCAP